eukprot:Phypoly_transcript_17561.p1 GENE.Phypoly_transcript_17561~~Phypoly_transcript_17561.p1  ORF type:complete len:159 (+),score=29.91 Phypoly_transcript_17561:28-477(+)
MKVAKYYSDEDLVAIQKALQDLATCFISRVENTDGRVTLDQWVAAGHKFAVGVSYEDAPEWWMDTIAELFTAGDKHKKGVVGQEEFVELITGVFPSRFVSATLARAAYQQVQGELDLPTFQIKAWEWIASPTWTFEDILFTIALKFVGR